MKFSLGLPDLFEQKWTMECCSDKPMSMSLSRSLSMMLRLRSPNMISDHFVCPALWHFFHHLPSQKVRFRRKEVQPNWHHIICPKRNTNSTTNIDRTKLRNKRQPQRAFIVSIGFLKILSMFFPASQQEIHCLKNRVALLRMANFQQGSEQKGLVSAVQIEAGGFPSKKTTGWNLLERTLPLWFFMEKHGSFEEL